MEEWTPLEDKWDALCRFLEEAAIEGQLQDPDLADRYAWPKELGLVKGEREQIGQFAVDRVNEIYEIFAQEQKLDPKLIGVFIMNSLLTGMNWQRDRTGK